MPETRECPLVCAMGEGLWGGDFNWIVEDGIPSTKSQGEEQHPKQKEQHLPEPCSKKGFVIPVKYWVEGVGGRLVWAETAKLSSLPSAVKARNGFTQADVFFCLKRANCRGKSESTNVSQKAPCREKNALYHSASNQKSRIRSKYLKMRDGKSWARSLDNPTTNPIPSQMWEKCQPIWSKSRAILRRVQFNARSWLSLQWNWWETKWHLVVRHARDWHHREATPTPSREGSREEVMLAKSEVVSSGGTGNNSGQFRRGWSQGGEEAPAGGAAQSKRLTCLPLSLPAQGSPLTQSSWKAADTGAWRTRAAGISHLEQRAELWEDAQTRNQCACFKDGIRTAALDWVQGGGEVQSQERHSCSGLKQLGGSWWRWCRNDKEKQVTKPRSPVFDIFNPTGCETPEWRSQRGLERES